MRNLNKNTTKIKQNNNFIDYIHIRSDINEPFYVGKGVPGREIRTGIDEIKRMQKLAGINELEINKPNNLKLPNKLIVNSDAYKSFYQMVTSCNKWKINWAGEDGVSIDFKEKPMSLFNLFYLLYAYSNHFHPNEMICTKDEIITSLSDYGVYIDEEDIFDVFGGEDEENKEKVENFINNLRTINQRTI